MPCRVTLMNEEPIHVTDWSRTDHFWSKLSTVKDGHVCQTLPSDQWTESLIDTEKWAVTQQSNVSSQWQTFSAANFETCEQVRNSKRKRMSCKSGWRGQYDANPAAVALINNTSKIKNNAVMRPCQGPITLVMKATAKVQDWVCDVKPSLQVHPKRVMIW